MKCINNYVKYRIKHYLTHHVHKVFVSTFFVGTFVLLGVLSPQEVFSQEQAQSQSQFKSPRQAAFADMMFRNR